MYSEKYIPNLHRLASIQGVEYIQQPRSGSRGRKTGPCGVANRARMERSLSLWSLPSQKDWWMCLSENGEDCFLLSSSVTTKQKLLDGIMESFHVTTYFSFFEACAKIHNFFKAIDKKRDILYKKMISVDFHRKCKKLDDK